MLIRRVRPTPRDPALPPTNPGKRSGFLPGTSGSVCPAASLQSPQFIGPFTILKKLDLVTYQLHLPGVYCETSSFPDIGVVISNTWLTGKNTAHKNSPESLRWLPQSGPSPQLSRRTPQQPSSRMGSATTVGSSTLSNGPFSSNSFVSPSTLLSLQ